MRALLRTVDGCEKWMMLEGQPLRIRIPIYEVPVMLWTETSAPEPLKIEYREYRFSRFIRDNGAEVALYLEQMPRTPQTPRPRPDETGRVLADLMTGRSR